MEFIVVHHLPKNKKKKEKRYQIGINDLSLFLKGELIDLHVLSI